MSPQHATADEVLVQAHRDAIAFSLGKIGGLNVTPQQAATYAEQEAAFPIIAIDDEGVTSGMRAAVLQPVRRVMANWHEVHEAFTNALHPYMRDIQAVADLQAEADAEIRQREEEKAAVERELKQNPRYDDIDKHKQRAEARYEDFLNRHANRAATMFGKTVIYWFVIALIGVTEWFINYGAFLKFFDGVIGFAAGTTVVLAVLLALASHGHGELLKQWSFRFGPERDPAKRWTDWRLFGLSTTGLLIVLIFAGTARYIAGLENLGAADQTSALGDVGSIHVDPARDVLVSMLANIGAWIVGVIVSYLSHDADPDYMEATRQYKKARRRWNTARGGHVTRLQHIEARHAKSIQEKTTAAQTRRASVADQIAMRQQIEAHDKAIQQEIQGAILTNYEVYRDALARIVLARAGQVQIVQGDARTPITPFDYKAMRMNPAHALGERMAA